VFAVRTTGVVAIAGADLGAEIPEEGRALAPGGSYLVRAGTTLRFGAARAGLRAYLALPGGIAVEAVLGSASTCLPGGFGGLDGRPLRPGDVLPPLRAASAAPAGRRWPPGGFDPLDPAPLAVVPVAEAAGVGAGALEALLASAWTVSPRSDRSGVRLEGPALPTDPQAGTLLSRGMVPGAIQLPPRGEPIVLQADGPTVGGYAVAAVVAEADLGRLAQRGAGMEVRFVAVTAAEARAMARERADDLAAAADRLRRSDPWESGV
ncbi:MAG: biotin-dependent carboxyltransferase family protein, partial [Candidatus Limnocylindrales bacterium]